MAKRTFSQEQLDQAFQDGQLKAQDTGYSESEISTFLDETYRLPARGNSTGQWVVDAAYMWGILDGIKRKGNQ